MAMPLMATASARPLFTSLLQQGYPSSSSSSVEIGEHYDSRLKDKRLQLSNPDRPRPKADRGTNAHRKLTRRDKKARKQLGGTGSMSSNSSSRAGGKGKGKAEASPGEGHQHDSNWFLSRRKRKHRGLEGLDEEMSYQALLPLGSLWTSYIQQFLGLVKVQPIRTEPSMPAASTSGLVPNLQVLKVCHSPTDRTDSSASSSSSSSSLSWTFTNASAMSNVQSQACKADLLGAPLEVIRAGNPSLVGLKGLVAKETEGVFLLALQPQPVRHDPQKTDEGWTKGIEEEEEINNQRTSSSSSSSNNNSRTARVSRFKVVPKHNVTFLLRIPLPPLPTSTQAGMSGSNADETHGGVLELPLLGNQMSSTLVTRACKKWKQRKTMDY